MRTAATIAAKVPMPNPPPVPVVVRVSRSSLIESLHIVALLQAITSPNVPKPPARPWVERSLPPGSIAAGRENEEERSRWIADVEELDAAANRRPVMAVAIRHPASVP